MAKASKRFVFLIDDEEVQNEMLKDYLSSRFTYQLKTFSSGEDALENMNLRPEIIILDYHLNSNVADAKDGVVILKEIKEKYPETAVIMLSGQDKIDVAIDTMKYGAYDYVVKGESAFARTENLMANIAKMHRMKYMNRGYRVVVILLIIVEIISLVIAYFAFIKPKI